MSYLVTGSCGCIGSWIVKKLLESGESVVAFDLQKNTHRMAQIMTPDQLEGVEFVEGDVTDLPTLESLLGEKGISQIIHLAALQVPACKANPDLGRKINIGGTRNVFDAASRFRDQVKTVVYASSAAVYGPKEAYTDKYGDDPILPNDAPQLPGTVYGETKKQNEAEAAEFSQKDGIPRLTIRPWTVYGPGRDFGLTSGPTKAMKAATVGRDYNIGFGYLTDLQFVSDIGDTFISLSRQDSFEGAKAYNIAGEWIQVSEIIRLIEDLAPDSAGKISHADVELAIVVKLDDSELLHEIPGVIKTPIRDGIGQTIDIFQRLSQEGRLDLSDLDD